MRDAPHFLLGVPSSLSSFVYHRLKGSMFEGNRYIESVTEDGELFNADRIYRSGEIETSDYIRSIPPHADLDLLDLRRIVEYVKALPAPSLIKDVTNQRLSAWLAMQLPEAPVFVMLRHVAETAWSMQLRFWRQDPETADSGQAQRAMSRVLKMYRRLFDGLAGREFVTISVCELAQDNTQTLADACAKVGITIFEFDEPVFDRSTFDKYKQPNFSIYTECYRELREKELVNASDGMRKLLQERCVCTE